MEEVTELSTQNLSITQLVTIRDLLFGKMKTRKDGGEE